MTPIQAFRPLYPRPPILGGKPDLAALDPAES